MLDLAAGSLDEVPSNKRDISSLTISVTEKEYEEILKKVRELRKEVLSEPKEGNGPKKVYQFNFQLFPLSKEYAEEGGQ